MSAVTRGESRRGACEAFAGRHVVITGGSSGIGLACARLWMSQGANLTLVARDAVKLHAASLELETVRVNAAQHVLTFSADVADAAALEAAIDASSNRLGPPEVLLASAGYCRPGRIDELPLDVFSQTAAVNYFGAVHAALSCMTRMRRVGRGHLVFVSSGAGLVGITGYAAYSPTKFAVRGFAEALRGDLKRHNIHVSVVYPPDTDTPQLAYEQLYKPPETQAITGSARVMRADEVALAIVEGVRARRFAIAPGLAMSMLERCASLLRPLLFRHFDHLAARAVAKAPK